MNKLLIVGAVTLTLTACGAHRAPPYDKDKRPQDREQYSGVKGYIQQQKDQAFLVKQANKVKCQDARLDLVDAEAGGNSNVIRRVKARLEKLCAIEE